MNEREELVEEAEWPPRSRKARRITLFVTVVFALALVGVWTQRKPIARNFVEGELQRRGVDARYDIAQIGFRTQRLENLIIGDPRNPDLTAEWAEVITGVGLGGVTVSGIRAGGVRLRGRLVDGVFSFGVVDKLLPPPSDAPFSLPDIDVNLSDARMRLDLPGGAIGVKLEGKGNLRDGFDGKLAAVAPVLTAAGCTATRATAWLDISIFEQRPRVSGPVRALRLGCSDGAVALVAPEANVDARLSEALDSWAGSARIVIGSGENGANRVQQVSGTIGFEGNKAATRGDVRILARTLMLAGARGEGFSLDGAYQIGRKPQGTAIGFSGKAALQQTMLDAASLKRLSAFGAAADGTPAAPLLRALSGAVERAGRETKIHAELTAAQLGDTGSIEVAALEATSASGMHAALKDGAGLRYAWPGNGKLQLDGALTVEGGGFPTATVRLNQAAPGAPIRGTATMQPYAAGGARLALSPVQFRAVGDTTRFDTRVTLDGPLGDGRVTGLTVPLSGRLDGRGGFALNPGCAPLSFTSLSTSGLVIGNSRLSLCPNAGSALFARNAAGRISGGARIAAPRLQGRLGGTPLTLAAAGAQLSLGTAGFGAQDVSVRLGAPGRISTLDIANLTGRQAGGGLTGVFSGTGGQIANVPLIISDAAGDWSLKRGVLALGGALRVADEQALPRFNPLVSDDFKLTLKDGRIEAGGVLREPRTNIAITRVDIAHRLSNGIGSAVLDVPGIQFGPAIQPDTLTRLSLGVVANVEGLVSGRGEIRWSPDSVTSDGVFRTPNTNLAAAFGPVTAASGEVRFTDLLGLVSAPHQRIALGEVNPGIAVLNGYIDYQLIEGQRIRIEGGRWPFAGGDLILEPAVLDFEEEAERRLTFRVVGLDAAQFVNQFEFKDINVTGTFDGVIPMIFDKSGGRIEGGHLVVRDAGGTLAYVGQVSNENLGTFGGLAFDALKSIKYNRLAIELNGPLDGEMVTQVRFTGTNQGTVEIAKSGLARQFLGLPFIFNIRITAPFRGLLNTARSFTDPALLIRQNLPGFEPTDPPPNPALTPATPAVQTKESEKLP